MELRLWDKFKMSGRGMPLGDLQLVFNLGLLYDYDFPFRPRQLPLSSTGKTKNLLDWLQKKATLPLSQYLVGQAP